MLLIDKAKAMDVLRMRLEALSTDGLNAPSMNAEYICRYKGSLIGKHFKSLAQLMPFAIYDLVPRHLLQAWNAIGELVVQPDSAILRLDEEAYNDTGIYEKAVREIRQLLYSFRALL